MAPDTVTWWGHATVAIDIAGVRLVTDPLLRRRIAFLRWADAAPPRSLAAGTDAVLVSHPHRDHLDLPSLAMFAPGTRFLVPTGSGRLVRRVARGPVTELDVGDTVDVNGVEVRAVHAEHDGRRGGGRTRERTAGPALGHVVSAGTTIYFAGDTDLFPGMSDLSPAPLDLAILPVGGWGTTLGPGHLDPARAARALRLLGARRAMPVHWGGLRIPALWRLRPERLTAPGPDFLVHAAEVAPEVDTFLAATGQPIQVRPDGRAGAPPYSSFRGEVSQVASDHDGDGHAPPASGGQMNTTVRYEFRLAQRLSPTARAAFPELSQGEALGGDMLYGPVANQEHLHSLLARFGTMGLTVTELRLLPD